MADTPATSFVKGADISWMPQMEANGYYWHNRNGQRQDLFTILKDYGITAVSLRTWVDPVDHPVNGHCGIEETVRMAARCEAAGLRVLLGFHFGDTWNSAGVQQPPRAWTGLSYQRMRDALRGYVSRSLRLLASAGVAPGWVKIGNETNNGLCHPLGSLRRPDQMTGLLNAAYGESKQVFPDTPVLVHAAQPQKFASVSNFLNAYRDHGGRWDVTGLSSYAQGGEVSAALNSMRTIQANWRRPVMQVEHGGPVHNSIQARGSLRRFITGLKGFGGLGTFFWEPEGYPPFTGYDMTAWTSTRRPTAALDGFRNV
ncbi:glycosyl hydrolase 53 family protein [Crossiella sp. NPDC003009]